MVFYNLNWIFSEWLEGRCWGISKIALPNLFLEQVLLEQVLRPVKYDGKESSDSSAKWSHGFIIKKENFDLIFWAFCFSWLFKIIAIFLLCELQQTNMQLQNANSESSRSEYSAVCNKTPPYFKSFIII